jgi:glucosyl-dolichyl phosphate glucuronosyltransferase
MLLSVVVCTFNRVDYLKKWLSESSTQFTIHPDCEVIIVDNNSSDTTPEIGQAFAEQHQNVQFVREPKQGLSHARNRGFSVATGEYVAYFDDDVAVANGWLSSAKEIIQTVSPDIFGGPLKATYLKPKPSWFLDRYASFVPDTEPRPLRENEYLAGGNIAIFRKRLVELGGFDPSLGMSGNEPGFMEETHFQQRLRKLNADAVIYYHPALLVYNIVRPEKMKLPFIFRQSFNHGRHFRRALGTEGQSKYWVFRQLLYRIKLFVGEIYSGLFHRDKTQFPYFQNYAFEEILKHVQKMGTYYEQLFN